MPWITQEIAQFYLLVFLCKCPYLKKGMTGLISRISLQNSQQVNTIPNLQFLPAGMTSLESQVI